MDSDIESSVKGKKLSSSEKASCRVIKFKAPKGHELAQIPRKSVDQLWRQILAFVMDYPQASSNDQIWAHFNGVVNCEYKPFVTAITNRGIADFRATARGKLSKEVNPGKRETEGSLATSRQLTELTLENLKKRQKAQGIQHISRMDVIVGNATTILEKESEKLVQLPPEEASEMLETHIDKANKLHKLAGSVYGLDQESKENNVKFNMSVLANYDPHEALDKAKAKQREEKNMSIEIEAEIIPNKSDKSKDGDEDDDYD